MALVTAAVAALLLGGSVMATEEKHGDEKGVIKKVIEASIGWMLTKDFDLIYNSLAEDYGTNSAK